MKTQRISEDVQSVHLYKHRPVVFHLYALPFAIVYLLWGYVYFWAKPQALESFLQTNETEKQNWVAGESNLSTGSESHVTSNISDSATDIPVNETVNVADDLPDISNLTIDELWLIGAALLGILHLLLCLSCVWSVHIRCLVTCTRVKRLRQAQCVKVVPTPNNGHTELVDLQRRKVFDPDNEESSRNPEITYWIEFQKTVLICDDESKGDFQPVMFPTSWNFKSYANWKGYETADKLTEARIKYGKNDMEMVLPKFKTLMAERATAPFFVFQVFCVGLWCLDEAVYYSLFTLLMLVVFEATLVQQQMRNMSTIRDMGNKPTQVYVYRNKKWEIVMSNELVAGDVISVSTSTPSSSQSANSGAAATGLVAGRTGKHPLPSSAASSSAPSASTGSVTCDLLLLKGQCIVDEAMLTGESVPQMKEPISEQLQLSKQNGNASHESRGGKTSSDESCFNLASHGKLHVIYGGTKVLQTSWRHSSTGGSDSGNSSLLSGIRSPPDHGCICFVLRTGFNTSQGKLLRTILFGVKRVTANNLETFFFILFLLVFAVSAASYVWVEGCKNPARSRYKLLLECTLIITSVVPPELPIELSLAVNSSMIALAKLAIFCTEPFRIPFAGKIDFCCFDKTGTLTSDTFVVEGVAGLTTSRNRKSDNAGDKSEKAETLSSDITPVSNLPKETLEALATCHSLGHMHTSDSAAAAARSANQKDSSGSLIGDPLEKSTFSAIQYSLSKSDMVSPPSGLGKDFRPWQILSRFHFTSKLKRMTTLSVQTSSFTGETIVLAAIKGAPETLKPMFEQVPADYDSTFRKMTLSGARVLAIGYRYMPNMAISSAKQMTRSDLECNLKFGGFLVVSCPLKPDSKSVMADILKSSHHVAMITGDNALTACHVAKELEIIKKDRPNTDIMILEPKDHKDSAMNGSAPGNCGEHVTSPDQKLLSSEWVWKSIDGSKELSLSGDSKKGFKKWWHSYSFCLTGPGLQYLQDLKIGTDLLKLWVPRVCVFARVSPQQKEDVVTILKQLGFHTLMCGDGTNDVGALKHAHCGVALLSQPQKVSKKSSSHSSSSSQNNSLAKNSRSGAISSTKQNPFANISSNPRVQARADELMKKSALAQKLAKDLEEAEGPTVVKLGDASIASPFTSKASSIESVCHIMKQGRCTLVTTLQMFKILALNALIFAYGQSVLYLDGVKFSDTQATLQGLLLAGCFLFVSRSQPLKVLSKERPLPNIFNIYTILTVCGQFTIHFSSLIFVVRQAKQNIPPKPEGEFVDLEKEFEPNILNSVVYLIDMGMQVSTFAVNYRGEPFMQSLWSHKPLRNCLLITFIVVLTLTAHLMPELNEWFQLVPFPQDLQRNLVLVIIADALGCWLVDRVLCFIFGRGSLKSVK